MRELVEASDNQVAQRSKIHALQEAMRELPQFKETLFHHFCHGVYARQMNVPAGTVLVGKTHKRDCINFIMQGEVEVVSPEGKTRIKAPEIFVSPANTKRAMVVIDDLVWVTVHASDETDLDKLEAELIDDHAEFLSEYGFTEEFARSVSETPHIDCSGPFEIRPSAISGFGVFAQLNAGEGLPALIDGQKTSVGRYANHSPFPNAKVVRSGNNIEFVALVDIDGELTVNYREVLG